MENKNKTSAYIITWTGRARPTGEGVKTHISRVDYGTILVRCIELKIQNRNI